MDDNSVELHVCVSEAQGLRLMRGGEIRLVITLRATDDPHGARFGAKVTPWQVVPEGEAPQWRPRECFFVVPADMCFHAEFVDSANLHIALMQRGHEPAAGTQLGGVSLTAAFRGASSAISTLTQGGAGPAAQRGEDVGVLVVSVGKLLVNGGGLGPKWVELADSATKVKGSLMLQLIARHESPELESASPPQCE